MTETPEARRGGRCGCLTVVPVITFLIIGATVMTYLLYDRHLRNTGLKTLSAAELAEYQFLVDQPIDIPSAGKPLVPSQQLIDSKRNFSSKAEKIAQGAINIFAANQPAAPIAPSGDGPTPASVQTAHNSSYAAKLLRSEKLTTEAVEMMSRELAPVAGLITDAKTLVADPAYTPYNHPYDYNDSMDSKNAEVLLHTYAMLMAENQKWAEAFDALQTLVELLRVPEEMALRSYYTLRLRQAAEFMAERTSDTAILRSILQVMNHAREIALHSPAPITMLRPSGVELIREMKELDYIRAYPKTLGEALALHAMQRDYDHYVVDHLPASDPRHVRSKAHIMMSSMSDPRRDIVLRRLHAGLLKPAVRRLQLSAKTAHVAGTITAAAPRTRDVTQALTEFDLTRLALARRIAQLENKPLPVTEKDFVPDYMNDFPRDLYAEGDALLQWDETRKQHFSVGPDGKADTHDDIAVKQQWQ